MSVAFDAVSAVITADASSGGTVSWSHTPTGTPKIVTVNVTYVNKFANFGSIAIAGITYGGVAMTQVGMLGSTPLQEKWILISPAAGTQTVVITWQDDGTPADGVIARATSTTFTASFTPSYGTIQQATGTTSPITKAVTGVSSTSTLDTVGATGDGAQTFPTVTVNGTGETKRSGVTNFSNTTDGRAQHYTSTQTGSGTVTANATESVNRSWLIQVVELKEGSSGVVPQRTLVGVGL